MTHRKYLENVFANVAVSCRPKDAEASRLIADGIREWAENAVISAIPPADDGRDFVTAFKEEIGCEKETLALIFRTLYGEKTLAITEEEQLELDIDFDGIAAAALDEFPIVAKKGTPCFLNPEYGGAVPDGYAEMPFKEFMVALETAPVQPPKP